MKVEIHNSCFTPSGGKGSLDVGVGKSSVGIAEDKLTTFIFSQLFQQRARF